MESDSKLVGSEQRIVPEKVVTTHEGDDGRTSLGIHGYVDKPDSRIDLMGGLDELRTLSHNLPDKPAWVTQLLTDMMVSLIKVHDIQHDERIKTMEAEINLLRHSVVFTQTGWFTPTNEASHKWDFFRVRIRSVERDAWRVYVLNEKKERFKEMSQLLNRLSDYSFLVAMVQAQK
jgi:cob(I)alamin adenosyltransferase